MALFDHLRLPGRISKGQTVLIAALVPLGLIAILAVPVGAGFDEIQHFRRAWEMSALHLLPNSKLGEEMSVPRIYQQLSYREQPIVRAVEPDYWQRYGTLSLDAWGWTSRGAETRSVYSPALLAPQSIPIRYLGRKFQLPALPVLYSARLAGLLCYLALAYLAVRWIPHGKWTLAVLVAGPLTVFQASTLTADTLSNAFGFLFTAGSLAIVHQDRLDWRQWSGLVGLTALLFLAKANVAPLVLLPLLALRRTQFKDRRAYYALFGAVAALFVAEVVGWNAIAYPREGIMISEAGPREHLAFILGHPLEFGGGLLADLARNGLDYLRGWIAAYGYYYGSVPAPVYWLWGGGLVAAILVDGRGQVPQGRTRWALVLSWLAACLATAVLLQFINVTPGSGEVRELQGRYFTAVMPLPFLALVGAVRPRGPSIPTWLVPAASAASLALFTVGMVLSYWIPCGSSFYQFGLCYQPQYKNWSPELSQPPASPPVVGNTTLQQDFPATCPGLTQVRVWPLAKPDVVIEAAEFELTDLDGGEAIPLWAAGKKRGAVGGGYALEFEPQWASRGRRYRLTVRASNPAAQGDGIRLVYTQRPEYQAGQLTVNGQASDQDLFFQYGCLVGFERAVHSMQDWWEN